MKPRKDIDICLLELREDVIETGKINNVLLRTICLPEAESVAGSSCFTSGISQDSKKIDAVPLNLFNRTYCEDQGSTDSLVRHLSIFLATVLRVLVVRGTLIKTIVITILWMWH